jgi:hypothetical protein
MPNPNTVPLGNIKGNWVLAVTLSPAALGATTSGEQTFTVPGVQLGDFIDISKPSVQAGLSLGNVRASALNTIAVEFVNTSNGTLTPTASEIYNVGVTRPENTTNNVSVLTQIT